MTNAHLRAMDRRFYTRALRTGAASEAKYRPTKVAPLEDCVVLIDREVRRSDGAGGVVILSNTVQITAFRDHIADEPPKGAQFVVGTEVFTTKGLDGGDESRWVFLCPA